MCGRLEHFVPSTCEKNTQIWGTMPHSGSAEFADNSILLLTMQLVTLSIVDWHAGIITLHAVLRMLRVPSPTLVSSSMVYCCTPDSRIAHALPQSEVSAPGVEQALVRCWPTKCTMIIVQQTGVLVLVLIQFRACVSSFVR